MIIVGAGIIGLSCAWRLSQAGVKVTVFDAGEAGGEASWAGAGMLAPGGEIDSATPFAELALRSLALYPEFVRELEDETRVRIDYRECGAVEVAFSEAEYQALTARAQRQKDFGIQSETCRHNGFEARFFLRDSVVNPRDVTRALMAACRNRGVIVREHEPVLEVLGDGAAVKTSGGEYLADGVLLATGAWSSPECYPVKGQLIGYGLAPGFLVPVLRSGNTYLLQRCSGLLIAGSTTEKVGFDRTIEASATQDIHRRATALLPELIGREPDQSWIGFRPGTDSEMPAIGRVEGKAVWKAFGHYRNGILLAPETARLIVNSYTSA